MTLCYNTNNQFNVIIPEISFFYKELAMTIIKKQHVLFVISDEPIGLNIDPNDTLHLIRTEVGIEYSESGFGINTAIPDDCAYTSSVVVKGKGETKSEVISDWLKNVCNSSSYYPFYLQRRDAQDKEE